MGHILSTLGIADEFSMFMSFMWCERKMMSGTIVRTFCGDENSLHF